MSSDLWVVARALGIRRNLMQESVLFFLCLLDCLSVRHMTYCLVFINFDFLILLGLILLGVSHRFFGIVSHEFVHFLGPYDFLICAMFILLWCLGVLNE